MGYPIVATTLVVAAAHDCAAALFLLGWADIKGGLRGIARLVAPREAGAVIAGSLLGGPVFMGSYVASMILAGPSYALTLTATYPVIGAVLADRMLRQRLTGVGWLAVVGTALGAALTAFDASSSESTHRRRSPPARTSCGVDAGDMGPDVLFRPSGRWRISHGMARIQG